jgi:transcription elongation factor GreB
MSKAFVPNDDNAEDDEPDLPDPLPAGHANYMTPAGLAALQKELRWLRTEERPRVCEIVSWAASLGDRSENGDYLYNKKRLREIDRRVRYLVKRIESAVVVDARQQQHLEQVFFGATVTYMAEGDRELTVTLVGVDEADVGQGRINWISPLARALFKARAGDTVELRTAKGVEQLEIIEISYVIARSD